MAQSCEIKRYMPTYISKIFSILFIVFVCDISISYCNDYADEIKSPRLNIISNFIDNVKQINISLLLHKNTSMVPSHKDIDISYDFSFIKGTKGEALVEFIINSYKYNGLAWFYPDRSFRNLCIYINGEKILYNTSTKALFNNNDITQELIDYEINPNIVGDNNQIILNEIIYKKYENLIKKGYFCIIESPLLNGKKDDDLLSPRWLTANRYWTNIGYEGGKNTNITYKYITLPGYDSFTMESNSVRNDIVQNLLKILNITKKNIYNLLSIPDDTQVFINWYTIPIANFAQYKYIENMLLYISSLDNKTNNMQYNDLIFARIDNEHIYSAKNNLNITIKNHIITNDILIVAFTVSKRH